MHSKIAGLAAVLCFVAVVGHAQEPEIAAKLDAYMDASARYNGFSGSVLVARKGQPILSKGYGMANYELDVPNTPKTAFRLGSITKSFTAVAILKLQERGTLNVSDSICKWLPRCPETCQPVTIRHLLSHTSGIPNYTSTPEYRATIALPVTHDALIDSLRGKPLDLAPGTSATYSNSGFYLLGMIIEKASGQSYEEFLSSQILKPLGMASTGYDRSRRIVKNRASGYVGAGTAMANADYIDMSWPFAGGALYSTVEDLLRFDRALYGETLLSRKSVDEMYTPVAAQRGLGWTVRERHGKRSLEKDGSINGFQSWMGRFPEEETTIIVLSNNGALSATNIGDTLAAVVFGAPYEMPAERKVVEVDVATLQKYVGQYQPPEGSVINVTLENGKLMRQPGTRLKFEMLAASQTEFFIAGSDLTIRFNVDSEGRVVSQTMRSGRREVVAPKIK